MVARHTPFEYDSTDDGSRRIERARLSFKPSRELADRLEDFILPSKRHRALGLHGLSLVSNYSWNVLRGLDGELVPEDALMEREFNRLQEQMRREDRVMRLSKFVVCEEVRPPQLNGRRAMLIGLKVSLGQELAHQIYANKRIPSELLSRDSIPVHIAFPEDIAIPSMYIGPPKAQLERLVHGHPISSAEAIGAGESPNVGASVTDMKLIFKHAD